MRERKIGPVLTEVLARLSAAGDRRRSVAGQRYFREAVRLYGVPAAEVRRQARELARRLQRSWPVTRTVQLCEALVRRPELEAKALGLLVVAEIGPDLADRLLARIRCWLAWHCGNWATADLAGLAILGPLLAARPERAVDLEGWAASPQLWVKRAAAVAFVGHARRGRLLGPGYRVADLLLADRDEMAHKAAGWLLKEAGRTDRTRLSHYLLERGPDLPRVAVRAALENFPAPERRLLLDATRGRGPAGKGAAGKGAAGKGAAGKSPAGKGAARGGRRRDGS